MADLIGKVESNELLVEVDIIGTGPRGLPGPKGDPGDVTAESIREALGYTPADDATAMEYKVLGFNGSAFLDESGNTLNFTTLHELCMDKKNFVYVSYSNRLYIPQYINTNNVWFEAAYIDNDVPYMHRLGINSRNAVNVCTKALGVKTDMDAAKESISTLENDVAAIKVTKADKSEIPTVPVNDVQINGASIVADGVANVPLATNTSLGVSRGNISYGVGVNASGNLYINSAPDTAIDARVNNYAPITSAHLDYAVKAAMTDGKGAAWTDAEKAAARARIGLGTGWEYALSVDLAEDTGILAYDDPEGRTITDCLIIINRPRTVSVSNIQIYIIIGSALASGFNQTSNNNTVVVRGTMLGNSPINPINEMWQFWASWNLASQYFMQSSNTNINYNLSKSSHIEIRGSWTGGTNFLAGTHFDILLKFKG